MKLSSIDILIPTFNNPQFLIPCLNSVAATREAYPLRIIVVNNGHPSIQQHLPKLPGLLEFIQAPKNLGWEGGLKLGLEHSDAKFAMFLNDDAFIPVSSTRWLRNMMTHFYLPQIAAVGPTSNFVSGSQNIWHQSRKAQDFANFLIGFCMLIRRSALDAVGGVDDTLPGGDDLDLSIRFRKAGYGMICDRSTFVFHHGTKTGERIHGGAGDPNGWNSQEMIERTNDALIRKHGFKEWFKTMWGEVGLPPGLGMEVGSDTEGDFIRSQIIPGKVLELGCGATKTVSNSIGVDIYGGGELIPTITALSVADIKADAMALPSDIGLFHNIIARHLIEHTVDPIAVLKHWKQFLLPEGQIILSMPNEQLVDSIPMNPEHRHAFTPDFIRECFRAAGFVCREVVDPGNRISMVAVAEVAKERVLEGVC